MKNNKLENMGEKDEKIATPETSKRPDKKMDKKILENHKQAAKHHMEAAKYHLEAMTHYKAGNYAQAAHSTLLAHGHHTIAGEFLTDDAKHHAQALKQTNYA
jgi:hypothetical protein